MEGHQYRKGEAVHGVRRLHTDIISNKTRHGLYEEETVIYIYISAFCNVSNLTKYALLPGWWPQSLLIRFYNIWEISIREKVLRNTTLVLHYQRRGANWPASQDSDSHTHLLGLVSSVSIGNVNVTFTFLHSVCDHSSRGFDKETIFFSDFFFPIKLRRIHEISIRPIIVFSPTCFCALKSGIAFLQSSLVCSLLFNKRNQLD